MSEFGINCWNTRWKQITIQMCSIMSGLDGDMRIWHDWHQCVCLCQICGTASWQCITDTAHLQWNAHESTVHLAMRVVPTLQALADAFRVNKSVRKVNLRGCSEEGLKARAPQRGPQQGCRKFGTSAACRSLFPFTWVLRADPSTHWARPWPQSWRSMKPSQRLIFTWTRTSSQCSAMKDARHSGLGGSSSKVVCLKGVSVCVTHAWEKHEATTCAEAPDSLVLDGFGKSPPWDARFSGRVLAPCDLGGHGGHQTLLQEKQGREAQLRGQSLLSLTCGIETSPDCETSQVNELSMKCKCLITSMATWKVKPGKKPGTQTQGKVDRLHVSYYIWIYIWVTHPKLERRYRWIQYHKRQQKPNLWEYLTIIVINPYTPRIGIAFSQEWISILPNCCFVSFLWLH